MPIPQPDIETELEDLPDDEQSQVTMPEDQQSLEALEFNRCPSCIYPCENFLPMLPRQFYDVTELAENFWTMKAADPATIKDQSFADFTMWPCGKFMRATHLNPPADDGTENIIPDPI